MKKIYTLMAFALVGTVAFGQLSLNTTERAVNQKQALNRAIETISVANTAHLGYRLDIYTQDFAGGLPSDWTTQAVSGPCNWVWTNVGHQGDFPSPPLASTTAANGWMILDSDDCNFSGGGDEINYLTGPSIDCSAYDAVSIRFEQYFRRYISDITTVEVSNNGGSTWTGFEVNVGITQAGTANPDVVQINITQIAANESDVRVRFKWEGAWDYGWQIDDFALVVPTDNDLTISGTDYQLLWISAEQDTYRDLAYSIYPISEVRDLNLRGTATNNGGLGQTGVALQVNINDGAGYDETLTSSTSSLLPGESQQFVIAGYTPPATVGTYTITYTIIQNGDDDNPVDNATTGTFAISAATYARDRGARTGQFTNFDNDYKLGTTFYMESNETVHCVGVALSTTSVPGTTFNMEILSGGSLDYIAETDLGTVPPTNQLNAVGGGNFYWQNMESPVNFFAGDDIAVVLNHFGGADDVVLSLSGNSPAQTSFFYEGSETTWFYVTSTPMVRLGLSQPFCALAVGVQEIESINVYDIFPNPSKGLATVQYQLLNAGQVQMYLFDAMGRVVMNQNFGHQTVGEYRYDFDFSHLSAGLYTYSIQVDGKGTSKKLVIE
jgi:hypothetical protein